MKWEGLRRSENVEDRRQTPATPLVVGGGLTLGTVIIALLILVLGGDPRAFLQQQAANDPAAAVDPADAGHPQELPDDQWKDFVEAVLASTEDVWTERFQTELNKTYRKPTLVLFRGSVESGCGLAGAETGPFYCPADEKIYIDLSFFQVMERKLGAAGDFAFAYVIAHEIGHHVQKQLGFTELVDSQRGRVSEAQSNQLSVRLELQADYLAGVWAHHGQRQQKFLEPGDVDEALRCARAIGDDTLQRRARGYVTPESFSHGSAAQRKRWLEQGIATGQFNLGLLRQFFAVDEL